MQEGCRKALSCRGIFGCLGWIVALLTAFHLLLTPFLHLSPLLAGLTLAFFSLNEVK
jgi:hypothetical protein